MSPPYLLPCSCGQKIRVEASQAGQEIPCACGAVLEVPAIRGLAQLERADTRGAARSSSAAGEPLPSADESVRHKPRSGPAGATWGPRQRLVFVGAVITAVGLGLVAFVYLRRVHLTRRWLPDVQSMSPAETWGLWHELRYGIEYRPPWEVHYLDDMAANTRWMVVASAIAAVGALTLASSLLVSKRRPRRRPRRPPKRRPLRRKAG